MIRRVAKLLSGALVILAAAGAALYLTNTAPRVPDVAVASSKPIVIKVHAQWCPVCIMTKGIWDEVASSYAGKVKLVVFDVTDERRKEASRAEAGRLGLGDFFDENGNWTGTIFVLDGRTKALTATLHGDRNFANYRAAIDQALRAGS